MLKYELQPLAFAEEKTLGRFLAGGSGAVRLEEVLAKAKA
jgi:hypothetical protein